MKNILVDAGPLIALFDKKDSYHTKALKFMNSSKVILITTWPVITEVMYMLDFNINAQIDFIEWIERGGLQIGTISQEHLPRIKELCLKYSDVPMDLADSTLILLSEILGIKDIVTIDSDFYIYRNIRNEYLKNIFI